MSDHEVNRGRHESSCRICKHKKREDIEREWVNWANTTGIAKKYHLSRDSIYRHAHALNLFSKRAANVRKALERIIEQADDVEVNASSVVAAIQAFSKINSQGMWVDRVEQVSLTELFQKMTSEELEFYAREGTLPRWFREQVQPTSDSGAN